MDSKALYEARQYHMNEAASAVESDLRSWKHKLEKAISKCSAELFAFLQTPSDDHKRHKEFMETLAEGKLLAGSSWFAKNIKEIPNVDVGIDLDKVKEQKKHLMDAYLENVEKLFIYDARICETLEKLYNLEKRLLQVIDVDDHSKESAELQTSILSYVEAKYNELNLERDYTEFCQSYRCFHLLRDALSGFMPAFPTCSICTIEKVGCALVPCGHAFCSGCAAKQRAQCFVCRCTVSARQQIYF